MLQETRLTAMDAGGNAGAKQDVVRRKDAGHGPVSQEKRGKEVQERMRGRESGKGARRGRGGSRTKERKERMADDAVPRNVNQPTDVPTRTTTKSWACRGVQTRENSKKPTASWPGSTTRT